jgi:hypothetical protein
MKYDFKHKNKQPENHDLKIISTNSIINVYVFFFRCNIFSDILHNSFLKKNNN